MSFRHQLDPNGFHVNLNWLPNLSHAPLWMVPSVICALMTVHTYPLFRQLPQETVLRMTRSLVPYLVLIMAFVSLTTVRSWDGGWASWDLTYKMEKAVVKLRPDPTLAGAGSAGPHKAMAVQIQN